MEPCVLPEFLVTNILVKYKNAKEICDSIYWIADFRFLEGTQGYGYLIPNNGSITKLLISDGRMCLNVDGRAFCSVFLINAYDIRYPMPTLSEKCPIVKIK